MPRKTVDYPPEVLAGVEFIKRAGLVKALAQHLGLSRSALYLWRVVPQHQLKKVADFTKIPRELLRPDLYGE